MAALGSCVGRRVTVCGYIQALRVHTPTQVVVLQDSTGSVQVTNPRGTLPLVDQQIDLLTASIGGSSTFAEQSNISLSRSPPSSNTA
jgi:aspartyl/asparaginyl-tRNA synthetase